MSEKADNIRHVEGDFFLRSEESVIPERITQARELRGLTKSALGENLGHTPAAITHWENGSKRPEMYNLVKMARLFGVPVTFFQRRLPAEVGRIPLITFRSNAAARLRRLNLQASRLAEMAGEAVMWACRQIALPECKLPNLEHPGTAGFDAEAAAAACRKELGLGDKPIHRLAELLESNGVMLVPARIGGTGFDAFSCVVNARPFIFLGTHKNAPSRTRFDTAHELAHLVLHQHFSTDDLLERSTLKMVEDQANAFAGAFLMPKATFLQDLGEVTLPALARLKPKWGTSIAAMVRRAYDIGKIDAERYQVLNAEISSKGWKGKRPEPYEDQVPATAGRLAFKCLKLVHDQLPSQAAAMSSDLPLPTEVLCDLFSVSEEDLYGRSFEPKIIQMHPVS
jgi:Zn-dependent peptidase ImmA (M78 family)/transcriptional regulator with XRE-family HTH domain